MMRRKDNVQEEGKDVQKEEGARNGWWLVCTNDDGVLGSESDAGERANE